jgi:hypothetical protein
MRERIVHMGRDRLSAGPTEIVRFRQRTIIHRRRFACSASFLAASLSQPLVESLVEISYAAAERLATDRVIHD